MNKHLRHAWLTATHLAHHPHFHRGHHLTLGVVADVDLVEHTLTLSSVLLGAVALFELVSAIAGGVDA